MKTIVQKIKLDLATEFNTSGYLCLKRSNKTPDVTAKKFGEYENTVKISLQSSLK